MQIPSLPVWEWKAECNQSELEVLGEFITASLPHWKCSQTQEGASDHRTGTQNLSWGTRKAHSARSLLPSPWMDTNSLKWTFLLKPLCVSVRTSWGEIGTSRAEPEQSDAVSLIKTPVSSGWALPPHRPVFVDGWMLFCELLLEEPAWCTAQSGVYF